MCAGLIGRVGELDASRLATLAGRHLRLDDTAAQPFGRFRRRVRVKHQHAFGHLNAARSQKRFRRVFFEVHVDGSLGRAN